MAAQVGVASSELRNGTLHATTGTRILYSEPREIEQEEASHRILEMI